VSLSVDGGPQGQQTGPMAFEFLIRDSDGGPGVPRDRQAAVLLPRDRPSRVTEGWGDFRFRSGSVTASLAFEDAGWHVVVEGAENEAGAASLVAQVASQMREELGRPMTVVPL
jgi:hypothetical protein